MNPINKSTKKLLQDKLNILEEKLGGDVLNYYGIIDGSENAMLEIVEDLASDSDSDKIFVILTTGGGSAISVERYVNILRKNYKEVNFIVPDYAYSAGTIFCMSGDKIYMDYFSILGPIDPQVQNKDGKWVAALGYLDKINNLIEKAENNKLTHAEFVILKDFDLAELRGYEQAKELTISLLKEWLVKYKFKDWKTHQTTPKLKGKKVTDEEKEERAEKIAEILNDNALWKSHARPINMEKLRKELRLKIEDYSELEGLREPIRRYYELMSDYVNKYNMNIFVQTRKFC